MNNNTSHFRSFSVSALARANAAQESLLQRKCNLCHKSGSISRSYSINSTESDGMQQISYSECTNVPRIWVFSVVHISNFKRRVTSKSGRGGRKRECCGKGSHALQLATSSHQTDFSVAPPLLSVNHRHSSPKSIAMKC